MKSSILALVATYCVFATCHPYVTSTESWSALQTTVGSKPSSGPLYGEFIILRKVNTDGDHVALQARDTASTDSTTTSITSTSSTTTSTTTSSTTTSSDTSTTSTTISTTASTSSISTTSSTSATSTTTSASTTSSSTTTSTSTTTTSTASATSSASAELAEWNRKGNITAVVFSVCLISLFSGISIAFCLSDKARKKRIAARELLKSTSTISTEPLVPSKMPPEDRPSLMPKDNMLSDTPPRTAHSVGNDWGQTPGSIARSEAGEDGDIDTRDGRNKTPVSLV
ncbi:hypothetical protein N7448_009876 [Penicillium atrosanguineum]|uniref:Mid2 domain-containing protein n=1 Tax=Penicillium atrosanguineum TaxID=1132637 RepID=A0A9W9GLW0_9EURO|nr:hypothetical protein N7448_009876 [Penicillium atrosanguineum]KAJ5142406.1 hypothetical protein N7526_003401 [Penicillium atrosanguineum]KAJ5320730.1 hypothetical protein N7476_003732 [Penicillium atrosanguineum]